MAPKTDARFPFCWRPYAVYLDDGPVARSQVFHQVMGHLDIVVQTRLPSGHDGRRTTARAKGKVERPFRTVKEMQETLYHFHEPQTEDEANAWLFNFLLRYNGMPHRAEPWRTGCCRRPLRGSATCAVGSGFVPLPAKPSVAR